jgi:HEAT repeat protein
MPSFSVYINIVSIHWILKEHIFIKNRILNKLQEREDKMNDQRLLEIAVIKLSDDSEQTRYSTVKELAEFNSTEVVPLLIKAVGDTSSRIREEALNRICAFSQDVIFPKLEDLLRDQENANLRTAAMEAFPRFGKKATSYLLRLLKDHDHDMRIFSATILGEIQDPAAVNDLIEALKDPNENVKHASIESLGRIGDTRAVEPLIDCLSQDYWIQYPAIIALGNIGNPSAIKHLIKLLNDEKLRDAVIEALGRIGDVSVIPVMSDILFHNNDPSLRNDMIASLVNIQRMVKPDGTCLPSIKNALKNNELINHLLNSLKNQDPEIKKNAIIALGWLKEQRAVGDLVDLIDDYELEEYVVGSLVSIGDKALPELINKLQHSDPKIQISLIQCIYWIGNIEGANACLPFLRNKNSEVRYHAMMAISNNLDMKEAEDALLELLSDPDHDIQETLVEMLGRSPSKSLVQKLIHELSAEDNLKKSLSIRILGRLKSPQACESLKNLLEDRNDEIRSQSYKALSAIRADQFLREILTKGIREKSYKVRKAVASCIKNGAGEDLKDTLLMLLKNPDDDVKLITIETLGKIGNSLCNDIVNSLLPLICDENLQNGILSAIEKLGIPDFNFFYSFFKLSNARLKCRLVNLLSRLKKSCLLDFLSRIIDEEEFFAVRLHAVKVLGELKDKKATFTLLKAQKGDPSEEVRKEACIALKKFETTN